MTSLKINNLELDLSMRIMSELSRIDRFDARWASIEKREGSTLKQLKSIATVKSVGASTRIEGSKMTDDEVSVLIENINISSFEERDQQEVAGYFETLDTIAENYATIGITESQIKSLHNLLMKHSIKDAWHKGEYKQVTNAVEANLSDGTTRTIFNTTEPGLQTNDAMMRLIEWYNSDEETLPLVKDALFVYEFLSIHPFQDGNGRLSRLLASLLLLKNGYSWIQYVSFEHEIENRKSAYYKVLMDTQKNRPGENVTQWLTFFLSCLNTIQTNLLLKLEENKKASEKLSPREERIRFFIQHHAGCSSGNISAKLDIPLPTVKKSLIELLDKKVITKEGVGRATGYYSV
jgi:Fic family protein